MSDLMQRIATLSPEKRTLILRQLQQKKAAFSQIQAQPRDFLSRECIAFPLSFAQQRLWFLDQLEPGNTAYLIPGFRHIHGPLQITTFAHSLAALVERHEMLRTTFDIVDDQPVQIIHRANTIGVPLIDLQGLAPTTSEAAVLRLAQDEASQPCNLTQGPLLRVRVLRLSSQEHVLLLTMHHIISDGWSNQIFFRELLALYHAKIQDSATTLPALPIQYGDFSVWQRQWLQSEIQAAQLAYWQEQLAGAPPLELPTDHPRPPAQTFNGATRLFPLPEPLFQQLTQFCQQHNLTLFMLFLASIQVLLARYSGQDDISVGTPVANRGRSELEGLIGFFVNTLVMRTDLSGNLSFIEIVQRVREVALAAYAHQDVPFEHLVDALHLERDLSRPPLFQVMFTLQNNALAPEESQTIRLGKQQAASISAKFDLTFGVITSQQGIECGIEYNTDLFEDETITHLLLHWQNLLTGMLSTPQAPVLNLPLLSQAERQQILFDWNATHSSAPTDHSLQALFEQQVMRTPDAVALVAEESYLTYDELNRRANQLAHALHSRGIGPEGAVGVALERSLLLSISLLGILKAGGAYLPLDPSYPVERLAFMLAKSQASVLLAVEGQATWIDKLEAALPPVGESSHGSPQRTEVIYLDCAWESQAASTSEPIGNYPASNPSSTILPDTLAYIIYTSGSTGEPKGVMNTHRGICNRLQWMQAAYQLDGNDRVMQKTPTSFDVSVWELFWPLLTGAQLVMARPEGHRDSAYLVELIARQQITTLHFVPSMLQVFLEEEVLQDCTSLRRVICSGEALPFALQQRFFQRLTAELHNLYGPTEAAVDVTYWPCQPQTYPGIVPIGYPIRNIQIYLLNSAMQPVPAGVAGELYIGGIGLARGYYRRPDLTAERFVPNPFVESTTDAPWKMRLYRTGDRARHLPDGAIEYLGRIDHQVKLRGFRIELGEIEAVLLQNEVVRECVILLREDAPGLKHLVAYVVPAQDATLQVEQIRIQARQQLPEYMLPAAFVVLDALPLTSNGKVNRRALPAPDFLSPTQTYVAPQTALEQTLATIWSQVLHREQIGIHDNFFTLGGDSILSIQIVSRARQAGLSLTPKLIFQHQTISALAQALAITHETSTIVAEQGLIMGEVPLTPIQRWFLDQHLAEPHHYNQTLLLQSRRILRPAYLQLALQALYSHHDAFRLRFSRNGQDWSQTHTPDDHTISFQTIALTDLSPLAQVQALQQISTQAQASLNLSHGPILKAILFDSGPSTPQRLLMAVHHLVIDGVSWRILLEDLQAAYEQIEKGLTPHLPPKTTSYQHWANSLQRYAQQAQLSAEAEFWQQFLQKPVVPLPTDAQGENTLASCETVHCLLSSAETDALLFQVPQAYHTQINDILLTALARTIATWTGSSQVLFHLEGHGREPLFEDIDTSRTVGWFTSLYPVLLDLSHSTAPNNPGLTLQTVKEQLRAIPHHGIGYGLLRHLSQDSALVEQLRHLPQAEILFNYLGQTDQIFSQEALFALSTEDTGPALGPRNRREHLLDINARITHGQLQVSWTYSHNFHDPMTIEQLVTNYHHNLRDLINWCCTLPTPRYTPSDFPLAHLSQQQLDSIQETYPSLEDLYPLSPLQEGLLFHSLYQPFSGVYITQMQWRFYDHLNSQAFHQAWQWAIQQHQILRTAFVWDGVGRFLQVVQRAVTLPILFLDWHNLSPQEQQAQQSALLQDDRLRGFVPDQAPLMRLIVVYEAEQQIGIFWSHHHLLLDGWSVSLLLNDILTHYQQICTGQGSSDPHPYPYRDYIAWLQAQELDQAAQFWRQQLADVTQATTIPSDKGASNPNLPSQQVAELSLSLSSALTEQIHALAQQEHLTINTLIQGVYALLLSRYHGEQNVIFGATVAGRPTSLPGVERMIGLFINTLPVKIQVQPEAPLWEWLRQIQQEQLACRHYDYTPLLKIQEWCSLPGGKPLFESLLVFENYPVDASLASQLAGLRIGDIQSAEQTSYPFTLRVILQGKQLSFSILYDPERFSASTIQRICGHMHTVLRQIAQTKTPVVRDLDILTQEEQHQLLTTWNETASTIPESAFFHQRFAQQAHQTPDAIALVYAQEHLSYAQLNRQANQFAHVLQSKGVGPEVLVGLCLTRSCEMVIGMLAILKAGGAYVPLDPTLPQERLHFLISDAQLSLIVTQTSLEPVLANIVSAAQLLNMDHTRSLLAQQPEQAPVVDLDGEQLAYIIYTSGSTGTPKGVMISQDGLANYLHWCSLRYGIEDGNGSAVHSSIGFDLTVTSLFTPLVHGRSVFLIPEADGVEGLLNLLRQRPGLSLLKITPAHLNLLNQALTPDELAGAAQALVIGGEALMAESVAPWRGHTRLLNEYGPTETVVGCCVYELSPDDPHTGMVAIGTPISNTELYILDPQLRPVPVGIEGELYIGGFGLARGYMKRATITAERFIPHPFSDRAGSRLYKSGDRAKYRPDGTIEYLGRNDLQIKLRGFRIELGEIESVLKQHPAIDDSVVMLQGSSHDDQRLVAYLVPAEPTNLPSHQELLEHAHRTLPDYMLPSHFLMVEQLPLTPNGKVDRQALSALELQEESSGLTEARSPIEEIMVELWREVLGYAQVSTSDNFFEKGGHSLLATQLISRIRHLFQIDLPLQSLFESPTLTALARKVEERLRQGQAAELPPITPTPHEAMIPLSFAQQRLWFLDQLEPGSTAYNIPMAIQLDGPLAVAAFEQSLETIVARHESLRTTFQSREGQAVQVIDPSRRLLLRQIDLSALSPAQREREGQHLVHQEASSPFNLYTGPLIRAALVRINQEQSLLLLTMHHIVSDGWSMQVLLQELQLLYTAYAQQRPSPLAPLPIQYADVVSWQQHWLQGTYLAQQLDYWMEQLHEVPPLELPTDHPRPAAQTFHGARHSLILSPILHEQLQELSQRCGTTLFMTLLAAFQVLLSRYSGQTDISVGTPIANRTRRELEGLIGFFVNTLVMRTDLSGNPSFRELLKRVRHVALQAYMHQDVPFEKIVEVLQPERDLHRPPLFQVMFMLQHIPLATELGLDVMLHPLELTNQTAKFDLTCEMWQSPEGLVCQLEYNTDLFELATIQRMTQHWQTLLTAIAAHPEQQLSELPLLTPDETHQLLSRRDHTRHALPTQSYVHRLIERQVAQTPDAIALTEGCEALTYRQLNALANTIAAHLIARRIGPDIPVAMLMERSIRFIASLLAILKANGVYLPLDPLHPVTRLRQVLRQSHSPIVLTTQAFSPLLADAIEAWSDGTPPHILTLETLLAETTISDENPPLRCQPNHLAYMIYTSGSTGTPKGVMVEHQGMLNHMWAKMLDIGMAAGDIMAQNGPQSFDISIWQSLAGLQIGASTHVIRDEIAFNPALLLTEIEERAITQLQLVPSMLRGLLTEITMAEPTPRLLTLRWIIPTGDALPTELCRQWFNLYPHIPVLNTYGSTECSDDQCHYVISHIPANEAKLPIVPLGFPIPNMQVYVLDAFFHPVPLGVVGELYIGGIGVGRGYLDDPVRTALAFRPDPLAEHPGSRMYKTSDLVRYLPDRNIEFLGRSDHLVKLRGYRIELGEIEAVLAQHPAVHESVVVIRDAGATGGKHLVGYVVAQEAHPLSLEQLRHHLQHKLPDYMQPTHLVLLDALPLNSNGKIDRKALPAPQEVLADTATSEQEMHTPIEEMLLGIWGSVLECKPPSVESNFFALGGHSLLATQVIARIRRALDIDLPLRSLFETPTIAGLARQIERIRQHNFGGSRPTIQPVSRHGQLPLSFAQQRLWFLDQLTPDNTAYTIPGGVRLQGNLIVHALEQSFTELVQRHESLRTTFPIQHGKAVQVIHPSSTFSLLHIDLSKIDSITREKVVDHLIQEEIRHPLSLAQGPLLRGMLFHLATDEHILLVTMHHIISDGWSMELFVRELTTLYHAFVDGRPSPLAPLPIQYADFAAWQRDWLQGEMLHPLINYWTQQLRGATALELPSDRPRTQLSGHHGATYTFTIPTPLVQRLHERSQQEGVTIFMTLLTAFQALLYRTTGQEDIVVGTDIANRTMTETESLLGFFVNLLALRTRFTAQDTFQESLKRVRTMLLDAYAHQDLPFEKLVEVLKLDRTAEQTPLINVLFVMQNMRSTALNLHGLALSPLALDTQMAKFDLAVFLAERDQTMSGTVIYRTSLFDPETIGRMFSHFQVFLQQSLTSPEIAISQLEIYTEEEKIHQQSQETVQHEQRRRKLKSFKRQDISLDH